MTSAAEHFARAVGAGDRAALRALLTSDVDFRAMTPGRFWESRDADEVVDIITTTWFGGDRSIEGIESVEAGTVADRERVGYRFRARTPDGVAVVEQQAYLAVRDDTITSLRIMCTGFRPVSD